jgi:hypothetical protein
VQSTNQRPNESVGMCLEEAKRPRTPESATKRVESCFLKLRPRPEFLGSLLGLREDGRVAQRSQSRCSRRWIDGVGAR